MSAHSAGAQLRRQRLVVLLGGIARSIPLEQFRVRRRADAVLPDLHVDPVAERNRSAALATLAGSTLEDAR